MFRRFIILCIAGALSVSIGSAAPPLAWPSVRAETKPWTRWWWMGNAVDAASLRLEIEACAAAGLGGLELTPIYGVRGEEHRFVPYLSAGWLDHFETARQETLRLGLGLDLANGTGWPFGGPSLRPVDAAHYLAHRQFTVAGGKALEEPVRFEQRGMIRTAGPRRVPLAELREPVAANPDLQELALDQVRFPGPRPLVTLMAFPTHGMPQELTDRVGPDGRLDWTAPSEGAPWRLYALFDGQHGKMVERAAPGGEGYALDHFSSAALLHYLQQFDAAFAHRDLGGVRAWFNDSYEVDDAEGEANFTPRLLDEFLRRRGYDLRHHLPALLDRTDPAVLSDYRETVSDLLRDEFTGPWRAWAKSHGGFVRHQAHGAPGNLLDLYAASDIPEQEGDDVLALKLASSAAHLSGQPLAAAETGTWLNEHFLGTLAELKRAVDTNFVGGINHIVYHGTAFSPPDAPWPGWQFYAAVELNQRNPLWADFPVLNAYVTRAQSWLQAGRPEADVLLYYNIHDRWAVPGDGRLPHFNGGPRDGVGARLTGAALQQEGYSFDFVSDRLLAQVRFTESGLECGAGRYAAIVVPPTRLMPAATLARLVALASAGARVIFLEALPESAPGWRGSTDEFTAQLAGIRTHLVAAGDHSVARLGAGRIVVGRELATLLRTEGAVAPEALRPLGLEWVRRRSESGMLYFVVNRSSQRVDGWVPFTAPGQSAALFDAMTGDFGLAAFQSQPSGSRVYLQLAPDESRLVEIQSTPRRGPPWPYRKTVGTPQPVAGTWKLTFALGGPTLPAATKTDALRSWTELGGDEMSAFSGTATYAIGFPRPAGAFAAWALDLGSLHDSARIRLNGREIAGLIQSPWRVVIPANHLRPENTLEILVTNLAANRIADLDRRGVNWKRFYNVNFPARDRVNTGPDRLFTAASWTPRPSGLLGPVTLTAMVDLNLTSPP